MSRALFWFRQDLRLHHHPALAALCDEHDEILPVYIHDVNAFPAMGAAQKWWLHHSLIDLKKQLEQHGLDLYLKQDCPLKALESLIEAHQIDAVYWSRRYEPEHIKQDTLIKQTLKEKGIEVKSFNSNLLNEPWEISNKSGQFFKVFTPYWKTCLQQIHVERPHIEQWPKLIDSHDECLDDWQLCPKNLDWAAGFPKYWQPGAQGALDKLDDFIEHHITSYKGGRDVPADEHTSKLSPHLHFGEISPAAIWLEVQQLIAQNPSIQRSAEHFLSEIGWREFSYHLLYHVPQLPSENFKSEFNKFPWHDDDEALKCWQKGQTGYPIVDAGMRELWHTGYMHNRVRMVVASFLTKDLFIDWRRGAAWFWDTLLDADLANNTASWQRVAGCGADAAPYFRIFNPVLQGEKFDPDGIYVKRWVPELSNVDKKYIHQPWNAPAGQRGKNYPKPLVEHHRARQQALAYYQGLKEE